MPMMTTTIRSSMRVKPFLLRINISNPREEAVGVGNGDVNYGAERENTTGKL
jgi:tetrahydromethanopterin S-methyltransferase subunit E